MTASPPTHAVWIARLQLLAIALAVLGGLVAGALLQLELWQPQHTVIGPDAYGGALARHAALLALALGPPALAGAAGYLAIARLTGARRIVAPAVGYAGVGLWIVGAGIVVAATVTASDAGTGWTFYTPYGTEPPAALRWRHIGDAVVAGAGVVFALHLAAIALAGRARTDARLGWIAALLVLAVGGGSGVALLDALAPTARPLLTEHATTVAAIAIATAALVDRDAPRTHAVALIAVVLAAPLMVEAALALAIAGCWIALAILGRAGRPAVAPVLLGAAPVLVGFVAVHFLLVTGDLYLSDTHVEVASTHLHGALAGFALLAACIAWTPALLGRTPRVALTWIATATICAGTLLHIGASIRLGLRGMPRRYWDYDPSFATSHQLAGIGAAVAIVGVPLLVIALVTGPRPRAP